MAEEKGLLSAVKRFLWGRGDVGTTPSNESTQTNTGMSRRHRPNNNDVIEIESSSSSSSSSGEEETEESEEEEQVDERMKKSSKSQPSENFRGDESKSKTQQQPSFARTNGATVSHTPAPVAHSIQQSMIEEDPVTLALLKFKGRLIQSMEMYELEEHLDTLGLSNRGTKAELASRLSNAVLALREQKSILVDDLSSVRTPLTSMSTGLPQDKYDRLRRLLLSRVERDDEHAYASESVMGSALRPTYGGRQSIGNAFSAMPGSSKRTPAAAFGRNGDLMTGDNSRSAKKVRTVEFADEVQTFPVSDRVPQSAFQNGSSASFLKGSEPGSVLKRPRESAAYTSPSVSADEVAKRILSTLGRLATPVEEALMRPPPSSHLLLSRSKKPMTAQSDRGANGSSKPLSMNTPVPMNIPKQSMLSEDSDEKQRPKKLMRTDFDKKRDDEEAEETEPQKVVQMKETPVTVSKESANESLVKPSFSFSPAPPSASKSVVPQPSPAEIAKFSFDTKSNFWTCKSCGVDNDESLNTCTFCKVRKGESEKKSAAEAAPKDAGAKKTEAKQAVSAPAKPAKVAAPPPGDDPFAKFRMRADQWKCPSCFVVNDNSKDKCASCETENPKKKEGESAASIPAAPASSAIKPKQVTFDEKPNEYVFSGSKVTAKEELPSALKKSEQPSLLFNFGGAKQESSGSSTGLFSSGGAASGGESKSSSAGFSFGGDKSFGGASESKPKSLFGSDTSSAPQEKASSSVSLFGQDSAATEKKSTSLFGSAGEQKTSAPPLFGGPSVPRPADTPLFGGPSMPKPANTPLFGGSNTAALPTTSAASTGGQSLFGSSGEGSAKRQAPSDSESGKPMFGFGGSTSEPSKPVEQSSTSLFGGDASKTDAGRTTPSLFGGPTPATTETSKVAAPAEAPKSMFGASFTGGFGGQQSSSTTQGAPAPTFGASSSAPAPSASTGTFSFGGSSSAAPEASKTFAFGATPANATPSNPATNSQAGGFVFGMSSSGPSLFGGNTSNNAPGGEQKPSMFGGAATGAGQPSAGGFGGANAAAPSFGGPGTSNFAFGGSSNTGSALAAPQAQPATSQMSLFGNPAPAGGQQASSVFGGNANTAGAQSGGFRGFGSNAATAPGSGAFSFGNSGPSPAPQSTPTPPPIGAGFGSGFGGVNQPGGYGAGGGMGGSQPFGGAGGGFGQGGFGGQPGFGGQQPPQQQPGMNAFSGPGAATPMFGAGGGFGAGAVSPGVFNMGNSGAPQQKRAIKRQFKRS